MKKTQEGKVSKNESYHGRIKNSPAFYVESVYPSTSGEKQGKKSYSHFDNKSKKNKNTR